jgi:hypothetical protein
MNTNQLFVEVNCRDPKFAVEKNAFQLHQHTIASDVDRITSNEVFGIDIEKMNLNSLSARIYWPYG